MTRIDAHHHFWDRGRPDLAWLVRGREPLDRTYTPSDLRTEMEGTSVDRTVLVQASNDAAETKRVLRAAAANDFVAAAVAWVPLHDPSRTAEALDACGSHPKFRGVRHVTTGDSDPDWLLDEDVLASLRLAAARHVTFDVVPANAAQLRAVIALAERAHDLDIVVDHLARPPVYEDGWEPWASLMERLAALPRVHVKVSVGLDVLDKGWQWSAERLRPYVEHAIGCFGAARLMFASNWPVCLIGATYGQIWDSAAELLAALAPSEQDAVLGGTAARFYHLDTRFPPG